MNSKLNARIMASRTRQSAKSSPARAFITRPVMPVGSRVGDDRQGHLARLDAREVVLGGPALGVGLAHQRRLADLEGLEGAVSSAKNSMRTSSRLPTPRRRAGRAPVVGVAPERDVAAGLEVGDHVLGRGDRDEVEPVGLREVHALHWDRWRMGRRPASMASSRSSVLKVIRTLRSPVASMLSTLDQKVA
jgi:hypothetical protein